MYRSAEELEGLLVPLSLPLGEAARVLDQGGQGLIMIIDNQRILKGIITDGDFRRAILSNRSLSTPVAECMNSQPTVLNMNECDEFAVRKAFRNPNIRHLPVVDVAGVAQDVVLLDDVAKLHDYVPRTNETLDCQVVIMAGGRGSRLDPVTRVLPKPLIPVGDRTLLEIIMDRFGDFGIDHFFISVNNKGKMIKVYLEDANTGYQIDFLDEDQPLGTAGALSQLVKRVDRPFFVTNCDILIRTDYTSIYSYHCEEGHELTIVGSAREHTVPYGVCEIATGGALKRLVEKPRYELLVNTGMYVVSPEALELIPRNELFHMTSLVEGLLADGRPVGVFPVSDNSWLDTGEWEEYKKTLRTISGT